MARERNTLMAGSLYQWVDPENPDKPTGHYAWAISESPGARGRTRLLHFDLGWVDVIHESAAASQWKLVGSFVEVLKSIEDLKKHQEELLALQETVTELRSVVQALGSASTPSAPAPKPQARTTRRK